MSDKQKKELIDELAQQLEKYVSIILKEYGDLIQLEDIIRLKNVKDFREYIRIWDIGTITSLVTSDHKIHFPEKVYEILNKIKYIPGNGINKKHQVYNDDNVVLNDNTFETYIKHVFIKGMNAKEFYEENLLHESMHFCGSGGSSPLLEGLTEHRTRELAKKYKLKTTGCGYPKEVKIVDELQKIYGEKYMSLYLFDRGGKKSREYLENNYNQDAVELFDNVISLMEKQFHVKYFDRTSDFTGFLAPLKKAKAYSELDYEVVYKLIDDYKSKHKNASKNSNNDELSVNTEDKSNNNQTNIIVQRKVLEDEKKQVYVLPRKSSVEKFGWKNINEQETYKKIAKKNRLIAEKKQIELKNAQPVSGMARVRTNSKGVNSKGASESDSLVVIILLATIVLIVLMVYLLMIK